MKNAKHLLVIALGIVAACAAQETETTRINANTSDASAAEDASSQPDNRFEADAADYAFNAQEYYNKGDYRRALSQFLKYKEKDPKSWGAALGIAFCHLYIGHELASDGRLEDADQLFKKAEVEFTEQWNNTVEKSTASADAHQWRACLGLALTERAIGNLDRLRLDSLERRSAVDRQTGALQEQRRNLIDHRNEYYTRALTKFRILSAMQDPSPDAFLNAGDLELVLNGPAPAERAYVTYLELATKSVDRWKREREAAVEKFKDRRSFEEANFLIEQKLASATSKTVDVMVQMAIIKFTAGEYKPSLQYLLDAQRLDPKRQVLSLNIAECYDKLGQKDLALKRIDEFIALSNENDPSTRRAYRLRTEILRR